jgi:serine protease Do
LKVGDRILEFDGRTVRDASDLARFLSKRRGGDRVDVLIRRDGKEIEMNITVGEGL